MPGRRVGLEEEFRDAGAMKIASRSPHDLAPDSCPEKGNRGISARQQLMIVGLTMRRESDRSDVETPAVAVL
jgi:hypothetical protein